MQKTLAALTALIALTATPVIASDLPMGTGATAGGSASMGSTVNPNMGSKVGAAGAPDVGMQRTEESPEKLQEFNRTGANIPVTPGAQGNSDSMFSRNADIPERNWADERRAEREAEEAAEKQKEADAKAAKKEADKKDKQDDKADDKKTTEAEKPATLPKGLSPSIPTNVTVP